MSTAIPLESDHIELRLSVGGPHLLPCWHFCFCVAAASNGVCCDRYAHVSVAIHLENAHIKLKVNTADYMLAFLLLCCSSLEWGML